MWTKRSNEGSSPLLPLRGATQEGRGRAEPEISVPHQFLMHSAYASSLVWYVFSCTNVVFHNAPAPDIENLHMNVVWKYRTSSLWSVVLIPSTCKLTREPYHWPSNEPPYVCDPLRCVPPSTPCGVTYIYEEWRRGQRFSLSLTGNTNSVLLGKFHRKSSA